MRQLNRRKNSLTGKLMYLGVRQQGFIRNPTASGTRIPSMAGIWSRKHLENLKRGLRANDVVKLANGFVLFSVNHPVYDGQSLIFAYKSFKMAPRLIAQGCNSIQSRKVS